MPDSWRVTGLHHVAFAHGKDGTAGVLTGLLGLPCAHTEHAAGFTERMLAAGASYLQLLEADGPGIIERFVLRRGPGLHHVAFGVSDIRAAVTDLCARGVRMVDQAPRPGGMGTKIAFIHPAACSGLLIELVEPPPVSAGHAEQPAERL